MRGIQKRGIVVGLIALVFGIVGLASVPTADAAINQQISFQAKLTNPDGTNVSDGTYSIRFRIYTDPSADAANTCLPGTNTCKWEETQASVSVASGNFQVNLGSSTALPGSVDFNSSGLYLGLKIGSDAEMTPRIQFTAAPYAFNADKVDGMDASNFIQLSPGAQQTGNLNINGTATIGNSLLFSSASAGSIQGAASQSFSIDSGSSGSLALGTTNAGTITLGKFGVPVAAPGGLQVNSGANVPTTDQVTIDNTSSTGIATAGVNGLNVKYKGGAAAVEGAGLRVDFTPGTTTGGTWSGLRIVAGATGATTGVTQYGLKLEGPTTPGSGTETGAYIGSNWDIGLDVQSGGLQLASQTDPATPTGSNLRIYAKTVAGRLLPKWVGPSGVDTPFQASFAFNRIAMLTPQSGTTNTTFTSEWGGGFTNLCSSCSVPALANTNLSTSVRRARFQTSATAGNVAYHIPAATMAWRGSATAGTGGYYYTTRFSFGATNTNNRGFVGLVDATSAPTNVDPTTNATFGKLGVGFNSNTGNLIWINNAAAGALGTQDLGTNFAVNTSTLYELIIFSAPNSNTITYRVKNLSTGNVTSDTVVSTNLPANATFMAPQMWITNNATNAAVSLETAGWYLESDN